MSAADRRRWVARCGAGALVVALLVLGLSWHSIDRRHRSVAAGFVQDTGDSITATHHASLLLPWGRLEVATAAPRTRLPHDVALEVGADVRPPDGGHFIGVEWKPGTDTAGGLEQPVSVSPARGSVTEVSLVTGGRTYPLAPSLLHTYCAVHTVCVGPYGDNKVWLAVDGPATDVAIGATYDGVTQTVDVITGRVDPGRAAGLSAATTRQPACGVPRWERGFTARRAHCSAVITRSVWVAGLGWAPSGHEWLVASVSLERPYTVTHGSGGATSTFYPSGLSTSVSFHVDGAREIVRQPTGTDAGSLPATGSVSDTSAVTVAYSVPRSNSPTALVVHATWNLDPAGRGSSQTRATTHVTGTWTVPA